MKKYIVVAVDIGNTVDGHSSLCGTFDTRDEAEKFVKEDMIDTIHSGGNVIDEENHEVWTDIYETEGCVWDIYEIEV